jgi:hypothetical protein
MPPPIRLASLIALAWASLLLYAAGCGGGGDEPATDPEPEGGPITLRSSGGYPPFSHSITIEPDGSARAVTKRFDEGRRVIDFDVAAEDLDSIRAQLDALDLASLDIADGEDCCDLVFYELAYGGETVEANVTNIPPGLRDAVDAINALEPAEAEPVDEQAGDGAGDVPPPR